MLGRSGPKSTYKRNTANWRPKWSAILLIGVLLILMPFVALNLLWPKSIESTRTATSFPGRKNGFNKTTDRRKLDTLVLYVFSNTDTEYEHNLRFFLRHGVKEGDGCDYLVVLQVGGTSKPLLELPPAPANVRFVEHPNECYDWGTLGWVLTEKLVDVNQYDFFIFMNSSIRGPFIPPYMWGKVRWQDVLISRITETVKLVGPTISCEGSPKGGNVTDEWRQNPHVQSYILATDRVGLTAMWEDGDVFDCHTNMWDVIYYSELGSSWSILISGYNIDSLMLRYQGVDWTDLDTWDCNANTNPYGEMYYDGITIDPFEVMFVKVKELLLERGWMYAVHAQQYDHWLSNQKDEPGRQDIVSNSWKTDEAKALKAKSIGYMRHLGQDCFDTSFYRENNWDRADVEDDNVLWEHWVQSGQFETRPHRFLCDTVVE